MRNQMLKAASVVTAAALLLPGTVLAEESSGASGRPDYLGEAGTLPIVKEGEEKTLSIACLMSVDSPDPEDTWFYKYIENAMNIKLEVTKFTAENRDEFISLMFADGDLPDLIIGGALTTNELVTYGQVEGQLADLAPYINEDLMPNLTAVYVEHPEYRSAVADADGHVWSLGYINDPTDKGQIPRAFINYDWLEEAGLEVPETLDDFIDALRAFKQRGDDIIPLGGSYTSNNPSLMILNAYGYNTTDPTGLSIGLRDGEVVLPVADRNAYGEYLKTMNTLYTEGLIDPDFFTMDSTTVGAQLSSGNVGFMAQAPGVFMPDASAWWGAKPLTSDYNDTQMWPSSTTSITEGGLVMSSTCEDPELAMAFADWFFGNRGANYEMSGNGPADTMTDDLYGVSGFHIDPDTKAMTFQDVIDHPDLYSGNNDYAVKVIELWGYKTLGLGSTSSTLQREMLSGWSDDELDDGYPDITTMDDPSQLRKTLTDGDQFFRTALLDTLCPYVVDGYPAVAYLDEDTAQEAQNLLMVISEYAEQESAKFITGARSLDELDNYFDEIENLGAKDYVKIYADYYASLQ